MCSYFQPFNVFNFTKCGLIMINQGGPQPLQLAVNTAFLASLYANYINVIGVPVSTAAPIIFPWTICANLPPLRLLITPKRVENKAVAVAQLGRSYPQGGDKLNKKRLANKKALRDE